MRTFKSNPVFFMFVFIPFFTHPLIAVGEGLSEINFDRLYPMSPFKKVAEECIRVWGQLEHVIKNNHGRIIHEAIIMQMSGHISYAIYGMDELQAHASLFDCHDLIYLSRIIATMEKMVSEKLGSSEYCRYFQFLIAKLHQKVAHLLQANNPSLSTRH